MTLRFVLIPLFCAMTGYTYRAVRRKIQDGVWIQGVHWRKSPDNRIQIDLENYTKWVEGSKVG